MIMEDDIILSCDLFEYFSYASKLMDIDRNIRPRSKRTDIYRAGSSSKRPTGPLDGKVQKVSDKRLTFFC